MNLSLTLSYFPKINETIWIADDLEIEFTEDASLYS